jgi:hypothetical protein
MSKLLLLEHRIKGKIQRVKDNIEIQTLNWVLNEITSLSNNPGLKERQQ